MLWILIPLVLFIGFLWYWKRKPEKTKVVTQPNISKQPEIINQLKALDLEKLSGKQACQELQKLTKRIYQERNLSPEQITELRSIEKDCQLMAYSDISETFDKEELRKRLIRVLEG